MKDFDCDLGKNRAELPSDNSLQACQCQRCSNLEGKMVDLVAEVAVLKRQVKDLIEEKSKSFAESFW
jgi:hypothetical protein